MRLIIKKMSCCGQRTIKFRLDLILRLKKNTLIGSNQNNNLFFFNKKMALF